MWVESTQNIAMMISKIGAARTALGGTPTALCTIHSRSKLGRN
ncbi:hypothetical protein ABIA24_000095 [Sinorhizobium fredii]|nr:hypothetical protein SF83666_c35370 [Sinorhizobium fredii CCBAU 83666]AWI59318.1 hypothetical protein AB395_00003685 [Sinorhizobium fredii CCBAU 45436]AWM26995.1 hypothetical protein AOX55_00003765 [Sinorhizobium fredii CCBAU 25509]